MSVQIGAKPPADFEQPIDLMMDCHRRVEKFLAVLVRVAEGRLLNDETRPQLQTALEYLKRAAPKHTADEEDSLFPRMRASQDPRIAEAMAKIDRLESDHQRADVYHRRVEELGRLWLAEGRLSKQDGDELARISAEMSALYTAHIQVEDKEVFPLGRQLLSPAALHEMGLEMKERRKSDPGRPGSRCAERRAAMQN